MTESKKSKTIRESVEMEMGILVSSKKKSPVQFGWDGMIGFYPDKNLCSQESSDSNDMIKSCSYDPSSTSPSDDAFGLRPFHVM